MKTLCLIFTLLLVCINANAETYIFAGSEFPLLSEKTEDGDFRGIAIDIARTITEKLGHTITIRYYPWARAQHLVKTGIADVLMPPYKTPEREKWLDFSEIPFSPDKTFFFVRPGSRSAWNGDFSSIKGKKIGITRGWSVGPDFEQAKHILLIDYASDLDQCFKKLLANRIDLVPTQYRQARVSFKRLGLTNAQEPVRILPELAINYNYFGFSKKKRKELAEFKKNFDREMKKMDKNGEIAAILSEYGMTGGN